MADMEEYMHCLDVIAECNHIETIESPDEIQEQEQEQQENE